MTGSLVLMRNNAIISRHLSEVAVLQRLTFNHNFCASFPLLPGFFDVVLVLRQKGSTRTRATDTVEYEYHFIEYEYEYEYDVGSKCQNQSRLPAVSEPARVAKP